MELEQSVEKMRRRPQYQQETSSQRVNLEEKPGRISDRKSMNFCWLASFPEPSHMELSNVEPDHRVCNDTCRGGRRNWSTELDDGKHVEQDKEQHGEQGKTEDVGGEL